MILQRMRVEFSKGEEVRFISHLDLMRAWHRALRRANVPLAYSEGFVPRPRLSLAAPLAVGTTGERELLDLYLERRISSLTLLKAINAHLPRGLLARTVEEVPASLPSLQSLVGAADYLVSGSTRQTRVTLEQAIQHLLALPSLPWEHQREGEVRRYDLRALILELQLRSWAAGDAGSDFSMQMRLRADAEGTGRPEQVMAALGLPDAWTSLHRADLILQRQAP
ncbi:MAG: DUF2344 domain-containing protein [Chloroflexi bacterium]|nr:DUF2344 domain-containing protein [Chloroflexota bacterium]